MKRGFVQCRSQSVFEIGSVNCDLVHFQISSWSRFVFLRGYESENGAVLLFVFVVRVCV